MKKSILYVLLSIQFSVFSYQSCFSQWKLSPHYFMGNITSFAVKGNTLFACSNGGGVFFTDDNGKSWSVYNTGLTNLHVLSLAISGGNIFAGTDANGVFVSTDNGINWKQAGEKIKTYRIGCIASNNNNLYAIDPVKGIFVSPDNAVTWDTLKTGQLGINSSTPSIAFLGNNIIVSVFPYSYISKDNGKTWSNINIDSTGSYYLALRNDTIYTGTNKGIYYSKDTCRTFKNLNSGFPHELFYKPPIINYLHSENEYLFSSTGVKIYLLNKLKAWVDISWGNNVQNVIAMYSKDTLIYASTSQGELFTRSISQLKPSLTNRTYNFLDINNVKARINANSNLFWDLEGKACYEVPKGTGKTSNFCSSIWVGGKDENRTLHFAGERYRQVGFDYYPGPVMNPDNYNANYEKWNNVWKINKSEIDDFKANWNKTGYKIPNSILTWPGNGSTALGQSKILAPFYDNDWDSIYNPTKGDYPLLKGDQAIYFIVNDDNVHTESSGNKLGIEIHAMIYAYNSPLDSALWNTTFYNYQIINRSQNKYDSLYVSFFNDFCIGYCFDDFIGSNVNLNSIYGYNGKALDGTGQPWTYGTNPPALSVTFLNPEQMNNFMYFNNNSGSMGDPIFANQYYNYMKAIWKDGKHLQYGGNGHDSLSYGPDCDYMFPGDTDPTFKGTHGKTPQGPIYWTEETSEISPFDTRGLGSVGPSLFLPGEIKCLDLAIVWARDYINGLNCLPLLFQRIATVKDFYNNNISGKCGINIESGIASVNEKKSIINIFPNPAKDKLYIELSDNHLERHYRIFNVMGKLITEGRLNSTLNKISLSDLSSGMYFITITEGNKVYNKKFIKN